MRTSTFILAIIVLSASTVCAQETQPALLPPAPHSAPQAKADAGLRKKYAVQLKDHSPQGELALAKTLRDASAGEDDPPMKFVMLREARDLAVFGGNFSDSFTAIDMIANSFDINAHDMKQSALALGMDAARIPPVELVGAYITIAQDELTNHDIDLAKKAMDLADTLAHDSRDAGLIGRVRQANQPILAARREQTRALHAQRTLMAHPDDANANLIVGSYVCGQIEQWKAGLPFLVKCGNAKLSAAASADIASPSEPDGMAGVGDAWWAVADADALNPAAARRRAAWWYSKAEPGLTGDRKKTAADRIAFAGK